MASYASTYEPPRPEPKAQTHARPKGHSLDNPHDLSDQPKRTETWVFQDDMWRPLNPIRKPRRSRPCREKTMDCDDDFNLEEEMLSQLW